MKFSIVFFILNLLISFSEGSTCSEIGQLCSEDCDCCGNDIDPGIQCEKRNTFYACYVSRSIGEECNENHECKSQFCVDGKCQFKPQIIKNLPYCPLTENGDYAVPVLGDISSEGCPCTDPSAPTYNDVMNAFDGNTTTIYANNWAMGSGIEVKPTNNAPLRKMTICSANDCPECDPTCYKVEGKCSSDSSYELIQEGPISFTDRNQCVDVPMGRPFYDSYRVTFPCQRGGFDECISEPCTCPSDPLYEPSMGTTCPNSEGVQRAGRLEFVSKEYDPNTEYTTLLYQFANKNYYDINAGLKELTYMILQWEGNCCFDCYDTYFDDEDEIFNPEKDDICFPECPDKNMVRSDDPNLCMQGMKLQNPFIIGSHLYFFVLKIKGEVQDMKMMKYGIFSANQYKEYDYVESPVCPMTPPCSNTPQCKNYPLQISELTLSGKCNEFESSPSMLRRLTQNHKNEKYMC